ncbi:hypothetical protein J7E52_12900 [Bacillus sp. ISL-34]|uniref:hypothetical protein n=1 Tax=Bacillus sp. ISL-34 TaxID=2819121 RepID=UPI001BE9B3B5|nr:hypothetical protein [Bacillus sp. ISL-34]MBT2647617.1 hypothetical protein [Bacillus sp. ISL-34]
MQLNAQESLEACYKKSWFVESFSNNSFKETGLANSEGRNEKFEKEKKKSEKILKTL